MIRISNPVDCCGCEACSQICGNQCIELKRDERGFLYPEVDMERCVECGLCERVCPILNPAVCKDPLQVYASKNSDEEERSNSSSGGVFILLAKQVIQEGGVVFGVAFDENWMPVHTYAESIPDLLKFQGSKYVQSRIDGAYVQVKRFLAKGRKVLFSGTPCQIAGLKHFLMRDFDNLLTVEVICHGVPSPKIWQDYLGLVQYQKRKVAGDNTVLSSISAPPVIESISFRDKQNGWRRFNFVIRFLANGNGSGEKGIHSEMSQEEGDVIREWHQDNLFMKGFLKNLCLRPSCFRCSAKGGKSQADISLGDFWNINQYLNEFDDDRGVTLVYIHSIRGQEYYRKIKCIDVELDPAISYNRMFKDSTSEHYSVEKFWDLYQKQGFACVSDIWQSLQPSLFKRCVYRLKKSIRRII